jgi:hypothetical protein
LALAERTAKARNDESTAVQHSVQQIRVHAVSSEAGSGLVLHT